LLLLLQLCVAAHASTHPHLVVVLVDDMGFNDFYNSSDLAAAWPHVSALSANCVKLGHFYTQHICTPSRASLMTGRMPLRLGLQHQVINGVQDYGLPLNETTLADKLQTAGYRTYGVGKWHLGMYNNASIPIHRGFDHWYGFYNGYEDYWQHSVALGSKPSPEPVVGGYVDLTDDGRVVRDLNGTYGPEIFMNKVAEFIAGHKSNAPGQPLFLYYAMQNVHEPLEPTDEDLASEACKGIPNADRKAFCGLARSADRAIANLTSSLDEAFNGEDYLLVISGDNGGIISGAGNNCPNETSFCMRGQKAELWEGGVRNNALVCSPTMLPESVRGTVYTGGMVHLMDIHATFVSAVARAAESAQERQNIQSLGFKMDGMDVWEAITTGTPSPRTTLVHNIDPCSGHGSCQGVEAGIRSGDWKYLTGVQYDTWYPVPTSASVNSTASMVTDQQTVYLFNVTADPGETTDLSAEHPDVVKTLQAKLDEIANEAMPPCNVPGGSCSEQDEAGIAFIKAEEAWVPWVKDDL